MSNLESIYIPRLVWGTFCEYLGLPRNATVFRFQETLSKLVEQMDDLRQTAEQQALQKNAEAMTVAALESENRALRDVIKNALAYMERNSSDPDRYHAEMVKPMRNVLQRNAPSTKGM